jgi:hypothetical protein
MLVPARLCVSCALLVVLLSSLPARADGALDNERPPSHAAPRRRHPGTMIAGLSMLAGSYLFSALVGAQLLSGEATPDGAVCTNCEIGRRFFVPIAGPWLALPDADGGDGRAACALLGTAQAVGLAWSVAGIVKYVRGTRAPAGMLSQGRVLFGAELGREGGHASVAVRF